MSIVESNQDSQLTDELAENIYKRGFHIIDHFLDDPHYHALSDLLKTRYELGKLNEAKIGHRERANNNISVRQDKTSWLDDVPGNPAINAYFSAIHAIRLNLNQSLFLGLTDFETHFAVYPPGAFYKKHVDQFKTTQDRRISCVYYLNKTWQQEFGGELTLYNIADQKLCSVLPRGNRFVCFSSELPHEVCETQQTRYSIAGWLKIRAIG